MLQTFHVTMHFVTLPFSQPPLNESSRNVQEGTEVDETFYLESLVKIHEMGLKLLANRKNIWKHDPNYNYPLVTATGNIYIF